MKRRIKLTIAYDGTSYKGWQIQNPTAEQPEGKIPTIQGALTGAIQRLTRDNTVQLIGASRTDSGVHAHGNVAVFDTDSSIPTGNFPAAINSFLPEDIRVVAAEDVPADFNPRFEPHKKTYEYKVDNSQIPSPMGRLYSYNYSYSLDLRRMQSAAKYLVGVHDFTSFVNPDSQVFEHGGDAVREIYSIDIISSTGGLESVSGTAQQCAADIGQSGVLQSSDHDTGTAEQCTAAGGESYTLGEVIEKDAQSKSIAGTHTSEEASGQLSSQTPRKVSEEAPGQMSAQTPRKVRDDESQQLTIRISGNGFLYHMIRIIVGTLLQVGSGKREPEDIKNILEAKDRTKAGPTVPARGLCLVELKY